MVRVQLNQPSAQARLLSWFMAFALAACGVGLASGLLAAFSYLIESPSVPGLAITLQHLRPIHEVSTVAWIFLGTVMVVYFYLFESGGTFSPSSHRLARWQLLVWFLTGVGMLGTLGAGVFSGREYLGFHPLLSLGVLLGWGFFAWNYFSSVGFSLRKKPVYLFMWSTAIVLFVVSYLEGHLYLLDYFMGNPVLDIAVQWKSCGTLVASFNLLVYGTLIYLAERLTGNSEYAHSNTTFALFYIGVLNSFTNYGHHTYHLPQNAWVHWISFVVSMLEIIILGKVFIDILTFSRTWRNCSDFPLSVLLIKCATVWTFLQLVLALLLSVPPVNALFHGTHMIVAHSMGSMIGIDTMVLFACCAFIVQRLAGNPYSSAKSKGAAVSVVFINACLFVFWCSFLAKGFSAGMDRYHGKLSPGLLEDSFPAVMALSGLGMACGMFFLMYVWGRAVWKINLSVVPEDVD